MPNDMNLTLPTVSTTPGPLWATEINAALNTISDHNHTFGNGAPIPSAALDINADLPFNGYNATLLNSTQFIDQNGALPSIVAGLYVSGSDLWFLDGASNPVQITSGGSIVGAGGTINGLPSLTASVTYYPGSGTYTFIKATDEAAPMDVGPVTVRRTSALSNGVTITPASGTTSWTLTLPASPVSGARLFGVNNGAMSNVAVDSTLTLTSSTLGVATSGIQTANIANGQITYAKLAPDLANVNYVITPSCNTYSIPSNGTPYAIPNLTTTFAFTNNRPIFVGLQWRAGTVPPSTDPAYLLANANVVFDVWIGITGSFSADAAKCYVSGLAGTFVSIPVSSVNAIVAPSVSSGVISITVYGSATGAVAGAQIKNAALVVYQL